MNDASIDVPCDRCGRLPGTDGRGPAPFSFCASCGLFVCGSCWSADAGQCVECDGSRDVATLSSVEAVATGAKAPGRPSSASDSDRSRSSLTKLTRRDRTANAGETAVPTMASVTTVRNEEPAFGTPADDAQPAVVLRGLSPTAASSLQAVGPGRALDEGVAASLEAAPAAPSPPPWVRRQRTPIIVRWANAITSGKVFTVILTILVGIALAAGAWALGVNANAPDEPAAVVVPVSSTSPSATPRPTPTITASPTPVEHRYVVRRGDTLTDIARLVYGDPNLWQVILDANRDVIDDADNLTVGVSLLIPELDAND